MKTYKIILIALLSGIAIGLVAGLSQVMSGNISFFGWTRDGGENWTQSGAMEQFWGNCTLQRETELATEGISGISVMVEGTPYDIYFLPSQNDKIRVEEYFNKQMGERDFAAVTCQNGKISIRQESIKNNYSLFGVNNLNGYIQIYIPVATWLKLTEIDVTTSSGDIKLPQSDTQIESGVWKNVNLKSGSGDIYCYKLNGDLITESSSGDQSINHVMGELLSESSSGNIVVGTVGRNASLKSSSGDQRVESVGGDLVSVSSSGNQTVGKVAGNASMSSQSGDQKIEQTKDDLTMTSSSGRLEAGVVGGKAVMSSQSGDQFIKEVGNSLEMNSTSGELEAGTVMGTAVMKSSSGNQTIKALLGGGEFEVSSGDISVGVSALEGNLRTKASSGDAVISLPSNSSFVFKANTSSGTLKTSYDKEITYDEKGKSGEGTVGLNAKYAITGESTSGSIIIR